MMKRALFFLVSLCLIVSSCEALRTNWHHSDRKVAKIGGETLYESDVVKLLPEGISPEDSATMVRQYVNTWALSKLLLRKAEEQLSKNEKDVSEQMEEYRRNLLGFRYEKRYIEDRIDTIVSAKSVQDYYKSHQESFVTETPVLKARVARISAKSPYYDMVSNMMSVTESRDIASLEELCYSSADRYTDFGKKWISLYTFSKEVGFDADLLENELVKGSAFEKDVDGTAVLIYIVDCVESGEVSPLEYNEERIRETLLSKRKQELLMNLEQDLLKEAVGNNTLKIYDYNE